MELTKDTYEKTKDFSDDVISSQTLAALNIIP